MFSGPAILCNSAQQAFGSASLRYTHVQMQGMVFHHSIEHEGSFHQQCFPAFLICNQYLAQKTKANYLQAMDHSSPISPIILLLPLLQPPDHLQEGALGRRYVSICWPTNVLQMLDNTVPILGLKEKKYILVGLCEGLVWNLLCTLRSPCSGLLRVLLYISL